MKHLLSDSIVITKRQILQLARIPELLIFSTIQPVMFVLLFRFVFGGSIQTSQPGGYVQLLMPGIFVQTVAFTLAATASGLAQDMQKGLIDRFRSLPISRGALVIGRTFGDALLNILGQARGSCSKCKGDSLYEDARHKKLNVSPWLTRLNRAAEDKAKQENEHHGLNRGENE